MLDLIIPRSMFRRDYLVTVVICKRVRRPTKLRWGDLKELEGLSSGVLIVFYVYLYAQLHILTYIYITCIIFFFSLKINPI